jgi:hypothetical protein
MQRRRLKPIGGAGGEDDAKISPTVRAMGKGYRARAALRRFCGNFRLRRPFEPESFLTPAVS